MSYEYDVLIEVTLSYVAQPRRTRKPKKSVIGLFFSLRFPLL